MSQIRSTAVDRICLNMVCPLYFVYFSRLNVGGTVFETRKSTILTFPNTLLGKLFAGDDALFGVTKPPIVAGAYVVDRDPTCFSAILNYYRTGNLEVRKYKH